MRNKTELSNRWHINELPKNILTASYLEWKYFNFSASNVSGILVYVVFDPLNITGIGGGRVIARIFKDKKIYGGVTKVSPSSISLSGKNAGAVMGQAASINVRKNSYRLKGGFGRISWDLRYLSTLPPIASGFKQKIDPLNLEKIFWEIKMPKAKVAGKIKIGGRPYSLRAMGYADADRGFMMPLISRFSWGQYNDEKISIIISETENLEIGKRKIGRWARIFMNFGRNVVFKENDMSIGYAHWKVIPKTEIKAPATTTIKAENKNYSLILRAIPTHSDPIRFQLPFSIPIRPVVIEQPSIFSGFLYKKSGDKFLPVHKISGKGFMEYTLRKVEFLKEKPGAGVVV